MCPRVSGTGFASTPASASAQLSQHVNRLKLKNESARPHVLLTQLCGSRPGALGSLFKVFHVLASIYQSSAVKHCLCRTPWLCLMLCINLIAVGLIMPQVGPLGIVQNACVLQAGMACQAVRSHRWQNGQVCRLVHT